MFVITKRKLLFILCTLGIISFIVLGKIYTFEKVNAISENVRTNVIVVDAGHGAPDGGATANGVIESSINLQIAKKLEEKLLDLGYDVIMTREDENNIANADMQSSVNQMKQSDLSNRVKIINESNADMGISIHLNKYTSPKYWGWQTFYSEKSEDGKRLANFIQGSIGNYINKENKRQSLKISNIKIVDKTTIPMVIVECGFISNEEEAMLLQLEDYQEKIVLGICDGIQKYYEDK